MEPGTLRSESFIGGAKWLSLAKGKGGKEAIAGTDLLGYPDSAAPNVGHWCWITDPYLQASSGPMTTSLNATGTVF